MRRCINLCVFICLYIFSNAQDFDLSFNHLSKVDGLSNDVNPYVYKDSRGFIWIGSIDGLNRFDGTSVKVYRPDLYSESSISGNIITSNFFEDASSNIWFSTYGSINCYLRATDKFVSFNLKDGNDQALTEDYHAFHLDDDAKLWIRVGLRENGRLYLFDIGTKTQSVHGPLKGQRNFFLQDSYSDQQYIVSSMFGLESGMEIAQLSGSEITDTKIHFRSGSNTPTIKITNLHANSIDEIYFGFEAGLGSFSAIDGTYVFYNKFRGQEIGKVWSVAPLEDRFLLITSEFQGLLLFDKKAGEFIQAYQTNEVDPFSLRSNHNYEVYVDRTNCVWVSNWGKGLDYACLGKSKFDLIKEEAFGDTPVAITSLTSDKEDRIHIATKRNGIIVFDKSKSIISQSNPLSELGLSDNSEIVSIYFDRMNRLWMIARDWTKRKSYLYFKVDANRSWQLVGQTDSEMTSIFQLVSNRLLLTTKLGVWDVIQNSGGYSIGPNKELKDHSELPFYKIHQDENNHVYFCSNFDRILVYDSSDPENLHFDKSMTQVGNGKAFLNHPSQDVMWVASTAGLMVINTTNLQYESFGYQFGGLSNESMFSILADSQNNLWIKTQGDLLKYGAESNTLRRYTITDGVQVNEAYDIPHLQSGDGAIWMAGPEGLTHFHPDSIRDYAVQAQPQITEIFINAEKIELDTFIGEREQLTLSHHQNTISLNFVACEYSNPERSNFRYRLTNHDPSWVQAGNQGLARYANIPWGDYVFELQASNSDGIWSTQIKSLAIRITPPWWATWWAYLSYIILFLGGLRTYILFRSRKLQRTNAELENTVKERTSELAKSLTDLKAAQSQLIQSEKMASLGEVTAGIAHEMQNPLNFVNNFSEVSKELIEEVYEEFEKGDLDEAKLIVGDIEQNIERINRHGKRAEGIVRNLLEHSRAGSRHKAMININSLCEEFVRLAYRNMRLKDESFDTGYELHYAEGLPEIKVVGQEIGKVLLNVLNNAMFAINERRQKEDGAYQPLLTISTEKIKNAVEIQIKDNGIGIPVSIIDKVFQPFFTTKPTGKATGLGLSLAYDIVTAHGGSIKVQSEESSGSTFTINLPIN